LQSGIHRCIFGKMTDPGGDLANIHDLLIIYNR